MIPSRVLKRPLRGDDVERWQLFLLGQEIDPGPVDGVFGVGTETATKAFQERHSIEVDGTVGGLTLQAAIALGFGSIEAPDALALPTPAEPMTATQFLESIRAASRPAREEAIVAAVLAGHVPSFLRTFRTISFSAAGLDGAMRVAAVRVLPDYLAIGTDDDFLRIPMSPISAQRIADACGCLLPTTKLVATFWSSADLKLPPRPLPAGPSMMSTEYYVRHQMWVEQQRGGRATGALIAGHKKDVVITNRLDGKPKSVAIFGWHQLNGVPIQPLSTLHENTYADYSHGIRLIHGAMIVDGAARPTAEVLRDRTLAPLLSDEGAIADPRAIR